MSPPHLLLFFFLYKNHRNSLRPKIAYFRLLTRYPLLPLLVRQWDMLLFYSEKIPSSFLLRTPFVPHSVLLRSRSGLMDRRWSVGIASLPFRPYGPKVERRKCGHDRSGILTNCARGEKIICVFAFINQVALGFSASRLLFMQINGEYQRLNSN